MSTITADTRTHAGYDDASHAAQTGAQITDSRALALAAAWQSPGTIGPVLAQLASTGSADAEALLDDIEATIYRHRQDTPQVYDDMHALAEWTRDKMPGHGLRAGDILRHSWGYDQTNIDYYEVTKATARSVEIRAIKSEETSHGPQTMTGTSQPKPGEWAGEPMRRYPRPGFGTTNVKINDYTASATPWNGKPAAFSTYA